jgi:hypothetical protein
MKDWPTDLAKTRARWLGELAYAGGIPERQAGWAEYVKAERQKLEAAHPGMARVALARFRELSNKDESNGAR